MIEELGKILTLQHNTRPQEATKPSKSPRGELKSFLRLRLLLLLKRFDWSCCVLCLLIFLWVGLRRAREVWFGGGFSWFGGEVWRWSSEVRFGGEVRRRLFWFGICFVCSVWMTGWLADWFWIGRRMDRWIDGLNRWIDEFPGQPSSLVRSVSFVCSFLFLSPYFPLSSLIPYSLFLIPLPFPPLFLTLRQTRIRTSQFSSIQFSPILVPLQGTYTW